MRILVAHNAYLQRGGEDSVVEAEVELLRSNGHTVTEYRRDNKELEGTGRAGAAISTLWSKKTTGDVERLVLQSNPDILHVHNTFPLISPSIYWVAARSGIPVVQTLHNFRLLCPQAMLLREASICEKCVGQTPWSGVRYACYRGSHAQTAVLSGMLVLHRALGTWTQKVSRYIALNNFCRAKFIEGGLPADRIVIKPNFVDFPLPEFGERSGVLFVGRLSPEKGIDVLRQAAKQVSGCEISVAGTGPLEHALSDVPDIKLLGPLSGEAVRIRMCSASCLVMPSIWYENFPRTLVEAFACGLPVIASRVGALAELVEDGVTGLLFESGNPSDLAEKIRWAVAHPEQLAQMGRNARDRYEKLYTADRNYQQLVSIYSDAIRFVREAQLSN